jgi:hypothetical protein
VPSLAVYTTVYPAVERYLGDWYASVMRQTDTDFTLWVAADGLGVATAARAMGGGVVAEWVPGRAGDTIASIRQRALATVCGAHEAVVLVDADDVLHPDRVASARRMLAACDVAGCALRVVDAEGRSTGQTFSLPADVRPGDVFPRANAFGLSNSAARTEVLARCLPIPADAVLVDWFLWTRAWLTGARFAFTARPEMDYRQYGANTARVLGPITGRQIEEDTERVRRHYRLVLASDLGAAAPGRLRELKEAAADVEVFADRVVASQSALERYVDALNREHAGTMVWWQWVAHPSLRRLWATGEREK